MNISKKLTSQQLQEILMNIYVLSQESEEMNVKDVVNEIKEQILLEVNSK
ncbi:hypothetical protein [Metabacillus litoralis]|nr:hypothetical protein [Metabacillus litoralis]